MLYWSMYVISTSNEIYCVYSIVAFWIQNNEVFVYGKENEILLNRFLYILALFLKKKNTHKVNELYIRKYFGSK